MASEPPKVGFMNNNVGLAIGFREAGLTKSVSAD
jgi:hypothetical protein